MSALRKTSSALDVVPLLLPISKFAQSDADNASVHLVKAELHLANNAFTFNPQAEGIKPSRIDASDLVSVVFPSNARFQAGQSLFVVLQWRPPGSERSTRGKSTESGLWLEIDKEIVDPHMLAEARKHLNSWHEDVGFTINYDSASTTPISPFNMWPTSDSSPAPSRLPASPSKVKIQHSSPLPRSSSSLNQAVQVTSREERSQSVSTEEGGVAFDDSQLLLPRVDNASSKKKRKRKSAHLADKSTKSIPPSQAAPNVVTQEMVLGVGRQILEYRTAMKSQLEEAENVIKNLKSEAAALRSSSEELSQEKERKRRKLEELRLLVEIEKTRRKTAEKNRKIDAAEKEEESHRKRMEEILLDDEMDV
ncbi:hypothetical protein BT69DRAFT_1276163, partial [Atractiella rhizophila]